MERIGIIGLGRMGSAIGARYAAQGRDVVGWTRSGRAVDGVPQAGDLAELVARADALVLSLFDDVAVAAMLDALLQQDITGKVIVETSTVVPSVLTGRIDAIMARGAMAVDAPISGGPELVAAGNCGIFIGGTPEAATRALAALAPLSGRIFHLGPLGSGLVMKTINNGIVQSYMAGLAEQIRVAKRAGLPLETALTILFGGPASIPVLRDRLPKMLGQDDTVGFTISGLEKDNDVFQCVAAELGVETPTLRAAAALIGGGMSAGLSEADGAMLFAQAYRDA